LKTEEKCWWKR